MTNETEESKDLVPEVTSPSDRRAKTIRLKDIAELAGVHVTTVSSVLSPRANSRIRVGEKTTARIQELAKRLNYRPHWHAQIMRKRKTGLIGLIEFGRSEIHNTRMRDLVRAVRAEGYRALTSNVLWYDDNLEGSGIKAAIDFVIGAQVEGVILMTPAARLAPADLYEIQNAGIPCVAFNGVHFPWIPQVRSNVAEGAETLTRHLLSLGRKRLVLVNSWGTPQKDENANWPTLERIAGFTKAIQDAGGTVVDGLESLRKIPRSSESITGGLFVSTEKKPLYSDMLVGYQLAMELFEAGEYPDALFCSNDQYAAGAYRACFEKGIKIPEQVAIVGFAGESGTRFFCPALTTMDTLAPSNANVVIDMLLELIRQERPINDDIILKTPCEIIIRESCGSKLGSEKHGPTSAMDLH